MVYSVDFQIVIGQIGVEKSVSVSFKSGRKCSIIESGGEYGEFVRGLRRKLAE